MSSAPSAIRGLPMQHRIFLYDLARNQRVRLPFLRHLIDELARHRYTMLALNLEYRFAFPSAPGICPPGGLTGEQARELSAYARERGVELVPQPNVAGHCEGLCALERYAHLGADPWRQPPFGGHEQLNLELPEARELAAGLIADACAAFPGHHIHVGCDEIRRMGHALPGQPERHRERLGDYVRFIVGEARKQGREVLLWGDMPMRHEGLIEHFPDPGEVIVCDWQYEPEGTRETLERYRQAGYRTIACPAISTFNGYGTACERTAANITRMIGDARDLGLDGFLLTTWECGYGSSYAQHFPWIAFAAAVAEGQDPDWRPCLAAYSASTYGVDGADYVRLHELLDEDLAALLADVVTGYGLADLRKDLFRGHGKGVTVARSVMVPESAYPALWEPGPFTVWYRLRPIIDEAFLSGLRQVAHEARDCASRLRARATNRARELGCVCALGESLAVLAERLDQIEAARATYHWAAAVQHEDPDAFRRHLDQAADLLVGLRPGLAKLRAIVAEMDAYTGFDPEELRWLDHHEQCLHEHVEALRTRLPDADSLLAFSEFLHRPARYTQRVTWR